MPDTNSTNGGWSKSYATCLRWIRRHRLPWLALGSGVAVVAADQRAIAACFVWLLLMLAMFHASRVFALICCGISLACAGFHHLRMEHLSAIERSLHDGVWMEFHAQIIESPRISDGSWRSLAQVTENSRWPEREDRLMIYGRGNAPQLGQIIRTQGRWEPVAPPRNAGEFNRAAHMRRMGVMAECAARLWEPVGIPHRFWRWTSAARTSFIGSITRGLDPAGDEAKVILAMVMGQQPAYDDDVVEPFRQTGTLHLFSVSGQHVNLVALLLWCFLRLCRVPRRAAIAVLIPAVFGYAWLTGASPPAIRAAWMAALFLAAFLVQRKADPMAALAVVFTTALLIDSNLLFLPGVQLSYGIVAIISIGLSLSRGLMERFAWNDDYLPRELETPWQTRCGESWQRILQSLVISTSACIGSTPLTICYFSLVTPISILTNLALTPLVTALLGLALFAAAMSHLSPTLAEKSNHLNAWVARNCIHCSRFFSKIPGAHAMVAQHRPSHDTIRIYDLPRGGGATLIQCRGADVLLDTGNDRAFRSIVLPSLRYFGSQPDTIIMSHPEAAHIGGGRTALQQWPIRQIISPVAMAKTPSFRSLEKQTRLLNVPVYQTVLNVVIPQSKNVYWEVVQVTDPCDIHRMADDRHAIHLLHFHEFRLLFLHDVSAWDVAHLSKRIPSLRCDVMIMGRHQLHPVMLEDAIGMFSPSAVIATHADFPASEKTPDSCNLIAKNNGISFFHQGQTGMVTLKVDDDQNLHMQGFLNHETCIIPRPR
jgi:competence protein ComEC